MPSSTATANAVLATEVCPAAPDSSFPVELSARGLHELALEAFRVGNRGRLSLCDSLRALHETRLYFDLGFPSLAAYADTFFHLRRAESFEYVRVAKALVELTELREAFGRGEIGWSVLKAITRVASVDSQASWIEFLDRNGVEHTLAEVRDALQRGRDTPRESSWGLPNLDQKLVLRFSRSDMEKVRRWIGDACSEVVEKTGAEQVELEQALLFLCERDAAGGKAPDGKEERGASRRAQIVYQRCPDCRRARVGTAEGFVEVENDEVERYEGHAEAVVIDGPTPPGLRRRILAREAGRCGNPRCHHDADHCHHIEFLSQGGKTALANEVAVCATCHALVHAGLLRVSIDAQGEMRWLPAISDRALMRGVDSDRSLADQLPVVQVGGNTHKSANADSGSDLASLDEEALAQGLMRLGVPAARSRTVIHAVVEALPCDELTEANVLRRAIASI